jgi:hypothetical protein
MGWLLHGGQQGSMTVLHVVAMFAVLAALIALFRFVARLMQGSSGRGKMAETSPNHYNSAIDSGSDSSGTVPLYQGTEAVGPTPPGSAVPPSPAAAGASAKGATVVAAVDPAYNETPQPTAIIAEVCSLQSPVRENVAQSYRGARVRWKLRLDGISEREEANSLHTVRMMPTSRSALACGVYFGVNLAEHPVLQAAHKDETFVVEGTIASVEDWDIDLKDIHAIEKAA